MGREPKGDALMILSDEHWHHLDIAVAAGSLVGLTVYVGASIRYLNDLLRELLHPVVPLSPRTFAISAGLSAATIVSGTIGLFVYIYHSKSRIKNALLSTLDEETRKTLIGIE